MKAHKRLMQSLRDIEADARRNSIRVQTRTGRVWGPRTPGLRPSTMLMALTALLLAAPLLSTPEAPILPGGRPGPGWKRKAGKWVRRK